ncbi:cyclin-D6-1-like isoform X5 [Phragmites australis]|uniref:cyclin-D6-1-like isoform X5 n=1 Tax=Phragmites australis TaxID=29695 RepID=UPI002D79A09E|nr:cyclin-D6-1-like isoform X5 [Phragmites australis]
MATREREREEDAFEYEFDLENPFTSPADEPIATLLDAEGYHSTSVSAAASDARRDAAGFISKFEQQPWVPRLLAISCLSLAAKMQRIAAFSIADIQRDEEFIFDAATVQRMERVVLGALEWRARSVTPLAFLGFFLSACYPPPRHPPQVVAAVKARAVDLLLRAQPEVKMAEFSPSVAAAATLLAATGEVAAANLPAFQAVVAACPFVNSEKLRECGEVIAAVCGVGPGRAAASDDTPVTVLGHNRSASSASESDWTVGSVANGGGDAKKRCMGPPSQWG